MIQRFTLDQAKSSQFHSKEDLIKHFTDERSKSINENYELMQEERRSTQVGMSLLTVGEKDSNILRIATNVQEQVSQVRIQMEKIGIPNKINFHKQASEILYSDLLRSYLNENKLEAKVVKLEDVGRGIVDLRLCRTNLPLLALVDQHPSRANQPSHFSQLTRSFQSTLITD